MMKEIILDEPGKLQLTQSEEPSNPGPGEALIRIQRVGVCGTDFHAFQGEQPFFSYPRVLGHELGVEIVEANPASPEQALARGTRCALRPYFNCGHCPACRRGKPNCCQNLRVFGVHIDGGMRDLAIVPLAHLHPAQSLSFEQLALVEPLSIGAHAVARAQLEKDAQVLVIGAGPIGLAVTQFAILEGARVIVMDISELRLAFCQRMYPGVTCITSGNDALAALHAVVADDLPPTVFDATGNPRSMQAAFDYVGFGGKLIFVGLFQGDVTFHDPNFHRRELTLLSSRNSTREDFQRIIAHLEAGRIDLAHWITHRTTSAHFISVFPQWLDRNSGIIKGVVEF